MYMYIIEITHMVQRNFILRPFLSAHTSFCTKLVHTTHVVYYTKSVSVNLGYTFS